MQYCFSTGLIIKSFKNIFFKLFFSNKNKKNITQLEKNINYIFKNQKLLKTALTHRSLNYNSKYNYERLEFLGDAILDHVISEWLYRKYINLDEGELTKKRSALVNTSFLSYLGQKIKLIDYINADSGLDVKDEKVIEKISANLYESIVGAIFLDGGQTSAEKFIYKTLIKSQKKANENYNYKGSLIELCHKKGMESPEFEIIQSDGPEHDKTFYVKVKLSNGQVFNGFGKSIKSAEQVTAKTALTRIE